MANRLIDELPRLQARCCSLVEDTVSNTEEIDKWCQVLAIFRHGPRHQGHNHAMHSDIVMPYIRSTLETDHCSGIE